MKAPDKTDNRSTIGGPANQKGTPANDFTAKLAAHAGTGCGDAIQHQQGAEYGDVSGVPEKGQTVEPADPATRAAH